MYLVTFLRSVIARLKHLGTYRHLIIEMSIKKIKAQYSPTLGGVWIAVINPLLVSGVIIFVFSVVMKFEVKNFSVFILSGIFPWLFFSSALFDASLSLITNRNILHQYNIPKEVLPISVGATHFFNFLIGLLCMLPVFYIFNHRLFLLLPLLIIIIILHLVFVVGIGMAFSVINVFVRDFVNLLGIILMFWFWMTPIFYPIEFVPQNFRFLFYINPMSSFVICYREVIFRGHLPSIFIFLTLFLWAVGSFVAGFGFFIRFEKRLPKYI